METRSREFTPAMAELVKLRDQWCQTPYCGAPIRHIDHLLPWAQGGPTSLWNAGGKCEACNYASNAPGWTTSVMPDGTLRVTAPTGHDTLTPARARPPDPPAPTGTAPVRPTACELPKTGDCAPAFGVDVAYPFANAPRAAPAEPKRNRRRARHHGAPRRTRTMVGEPRIPTRHTRSVAAEPRISTRQLLWLSRLPTGLTAGPVCDSSAGGPRFGIGGERGNLVGPQGRLDDYPGGGDVGCRDRG